jgi:hypothetical protein
VLFKGFSPGERCDIIYWTSENLAAMWKKDCRGIEKEEDSREAANDRGGCLGINRMVIVKAEKRGLIGICLECTADWIC